MTPAALGKIRIHKAKLRLPGQSVFTVCGAASWVWPQSTSKKRLRCWLTNRGLTKNIWRLHPIVLSRCWMFWDEGERPQVTERRAGCYGSHNLQLGDGNTVWLATAVTWHAHWQQGEAEVTSAWPLEVVVVVVVGDGGGGVGWAAVAASAPKGCPSSVHASVTDWIPASFCAFRQLTDLTHVN